MPGGDRNWTITPTLLWFGACLGVGLCVFDGGVQAVADRFVRHRGDSEGAAAPATPGSFTAKPKQVADSGPPPATYTKPPPPPADTPKGDRTHLGVLEDVCLDGTPTACKRWGMDAFYKAIAQSKAGKLGHPVRVSWFGDSVIASDHIPGRLRVRMQSELGDGGPGYVFIVAPHRFCNHQAITRSWNDFNAPFAISTYQIPDGMYGVGESSVDTTGGNATIKIAKGTATKAELYYLSQPKGGRVILAADGSEVVRAETKGDKAPGFAAATISSGGKKFDITTEGTVRLFGIVLENASGAVVDNLGIVSVNVNSYGNTNGDHWAAELGHRAADLNMIMIGANEAEWLHPWDGDMKTYQQRYEKILAPMRKGRPDGACLVVSPTDQAEAKDGEYVSRPVMPVLVEAQRKAALAQGCAFYSTYTWMGGKGSAYKWFAKGLVGSDFQHLSDKGAEIMADAVYETLMAGYRRYAGI